MIFLRRAEHLPIAVDFGFDTVKLLQLQERGGTLRVQSAAQEPVPAAPNVTPLERLQPTISRLWELFKRHQFKGRQVVSILPRDLVQVKTIRMPVLPEAELQAAIQHEAGALFSADPATLTIRHITAGEVKQGTEARLEVIVHAVENAVIGQLLEAYHGVGLLVDSLDLEACSLYRGIERFVRRREDETEVHVLVDIGARQSKVIIGRGRDVTFSKLIDIGGNSFSECVAKKLGLSLDESTSLRRRFAATPEGEERDPVRQTVTDATRTAMSALAHEVSLCLRYYSVTFRGQRPARVRLAGGEALDPLLRQALATSLPVPLELYEPFHGIDTTAMTTSSGPSLCEWSVAFGAALRRVRANVRRLEGEPAFGRRKGDAPLVEVVDLSTAVKSVPAADAGRRAEEPAYA